MVTAEAARAARAVLQRNIRDIPVLRRLWEEALEAARYTPDLTSIEAARYAFGLQRSRFWRRVMGDSGAKTLFEDAGFVFRGGGAPDFVGLEGRFAKVSIDHVAEISENSLRALDLDNLRFLIAGDNTILATLRRYMPDWPQ